MMMMEVDGEDDGGGAGPEVEMASLRVSSPAPVRERLPGEKTSLHPFSVEADLSTTKRARTTGPPTPIATSKKPPTKSTAKTPSAKTAKAKAKKTATGHQSTTTSTQ